MGLSTIGRKGCNGNRSCLKVFKFNSSIIYIYTWVYILTPTHYQIRLKSIKKIFCSTCCQSGLSLWLLLGSWIWLSLMLEYQFTTFWHQCLWVRAEGNVNKGWKIMGVLRFEMRNNTMPITNMACARELLIMIKCLFNYQINTPFKVWPHGTSWLVMLVYLSASSSLNLKLWIMKLMLW